MTWSGCFFSVVEAIGLSGPSDSINRVEKCFGHPYGSWFCFFGVLLAFLKGLLGVYASAKNDTFLDAQKSYKTSASKQMGRNYAQLYIQICTHRFDVVFCVKTFSPRKASVDVPDCEGKTALHWAASKGRSRWTQRVFLLKDFCVIVHIFLGGFFCANPM